MVSQGKNDESHLEGKLDDTISQQPNDTSGNLVKHNESLVSFSFLSAQQKKQITDSHHGSSNFPVD